jgi:hypothetical protein
LEVLWLLLFEIVYVSERAAITWVGIGVEEWARRIVDLREGNSFLGAAR